MPVAHAAVGGSAIARILRCPGSVRLAAGLPRVASKAADRGTMLHYFLGRVLDKGIEPSSLIGQSYAGTKLEYADAKTMLVPARAMTYRFIGDCRPLTEQRVRFEKNVWGTADLLAHRSRLGYLVDFKFGTHAVPALESEQLQFYAAAAWEQKKFGSQPLAVHAAIIQPSVSTKVDSVAYTPHDLTEFAKRVRTAAKAAFAPDAPVIPGEIQCKWCPVKQAGKCPAQRQATDLPTALARAKFWI